MKYKLRKFLIRINEKLIQQLKQKQDKLIELGSDSNYFAETEFLIKNFRKISLFDFWRKYVDGPEAPHYNIPYKGRKLTKFPSDMFIYPDIVYRFKPDLIIEIGTQRGGSSIFFADLLKPLGGNVLTIDIKPPTDAETLRLFEEMNITSLKGDITDSLIIKKIIDFCEGKKCMIIDDGSHYEEHVYYTFCKLNHLIPIGGLYIIEDGMTTAIYHRYVEKYKTNRAIARILHKYPNFELFRDYDIFIFSTVLKGILQRKK